jgi:hypothetical protein
MTKTKYIGFAVALAMIGTTAGFLMYWKSNQRLGKPGVKVGATPLYDEKGKTIATESVLLPDTVAGYGSRLLPVTSAELNTLPKDTTYGKRLYEHRDGFQVQTSVVLMGTDRTSIHKPQFCLTGQGWSIDKSELTSVKVDSPMPYELPVMKLTTAIQVKDKSGKPITVRGIYVYWFVADDRLTAEHGERMISMAKTLASRAVLERWAYVSFFAKCWPGQEEATYDRIQNLITASVPEFQLAAGEPPPSETAAIVSEKP